MTSKASLSQIPETSTHVVVPQQSVALSFVKQAEIKITSFQALLEHDANNKKIKVITAKDADEILKTQKFPEQCRSYRLRTTEDEPVTQAVSLSQIKFLDETEDSLLQDFMKKVKRLESMKGYISEQEEKRKHRVEQERLAFLEQFKRSHKELGMTPPVVPYEMEAIRFKELNLVPVSKFQTVSPRPVDDVKRRPVSAPRANKPPELDAKAQAEVAKSLIKKFETRFRFLQNPQFHEMIAKKKVERRASFSLIPEVILFDDYEPGQSYSKTFELKNVSPHCRRVRMILPEKPSPYFLMEPTSFPNNSGSVPPGLSCVFTVTFTPDSRRQYELEPLIGIDLGEFIKIPLKAKRRSIDLEFSEVLDCGVCRAGFTTKRVWNLVNQGNQGSGRIFAIDDISQLSSEEIKSLFDQHKDSELVIGPFTIKPASFELQREEKFSLEILTNPLITDDHVEFDLKFTIIYDNFDVKTVRVKALSELPNLSCVSVIEKANTKPILFEPSDIFKKYGMAIDVGEQNLFAVTKKWFTVRSQCHLKLPYSWSLISQKKDKGESTFTMTPMSGVFEPEQEQKFEISFTSPNIAKYEVSAFLNLSNISDEFYCEDDARPQEVGFNLKLYAKSLPHRLTIEPSIPEFPRSLVIDEQSTIKMKVANEGFADFHYNCDLILDNNFVELVKYEGWTGDLAPGSSKSCQISLRASGIGKATGVFVINTDDGSKTKIPLSINVLFPTDSLTIDRPHIDYGILRKFKEQKTPVVLSNRSSKPLYWKLDLQNMIPDVILAGKLIVEPTSGVVQPKQHTSIVVRFQGIQDGEFNHLLKFSGSVDGISYFDLVHGQIQAIIETPKAVLLPAKLDLGMCYLGVDGTAQVSIKSQSLLDTTFTWLNRDCKDYTIRFNPATGTLKGGQTLDTTIIFKPKRLGVIKNIWLVCKISHMEQNNGYLGVVMQAEATGFSFSYSVSNLVVTETEEASTGNIKVSEKKRESTILDFGKDCPIFGRRRRTLILENKCGFEVPFSLSFENYGASTVNNAALPLVQNESKTPSNLIFESDGVGFKSKQGQLYSQTKTNSRAFSSSNEKYLRENRGIAFFAQPQTGSMPPFGKVEVHIFAVNNFWGVFEDNLTVNFKSWTSMEIPISIGVVGTPLYFHGQSSIDGSDGGVNLSIVLADKNNTVPYLTSVKKTVIVENLSPKTIAIDWRTFQRRDMTKKKPLQFMVEYNQFLVWKKLQTRFTLANQAVIEDGMPFDVEPKRLQLAPFSKGTISVQLHSQTPGNVTGFLYGDVGYVYAGRIYWAEKSDSEIPWKSKFHAGPMILSVRGKVIEPTLQLCSGKPAISLKCRAVDAAQTDDGYQVWRRVAPIKNAIEGSVAFNARAEPDSFKVQVMAKKKNNLFHLDPNVEAFIQVEFYQKEPGVAKETKGFVEIEYCNGSIQRIPVHVIPTI